MSNLKELTWEQHKAAERQPFVKVLLSGNINPKLYATYLWNQYIKYKELEQLADKYGLLKDLPQIKREQKIYSDFLELWTYSEDPITLPSTRSYLKSLRIISNKQHLFAHIYVHHMGDLSGGQMIAKRVPGGGRMYSFQSSIEDLKTTIRSKCTDNMAEEAKNCFNYAIKLFQELDELDIPNYA